MRIDPEVAHGSYATGCVVIHTRDEFLLDFIAAVPPPARIVTRVVLTPAHLKRALSAFLDNFRQYEKRYRAIDLPPENSRANAGQVKDLYSKLEVKDQFLGGTFSNSMSIMHTSEEFVLDFLTNFPPAPKVNARVIVSPTHARRIISILGDNIAQYEDRFGKIDDGLPPPEPRAAFNLN